MNNIAENFSPLPVKFTSNRFDIVNLCVLTYTVYFQRFWKKHSAFYIREMTIEIKKKKKHVKWKVGNNSTFLIMIFYDKSLWYDTILKLSGLDRFAI